MNKLRSRNISPYDKRGHYVHPSLEAALSDGLQSGLHSIDFQGEWYDFLYEDNGAKVTLVTFNAAVRLDHSFPVFSGWSFPKKMQINLLAFSDPAIAMTPPVRTLWHLGTDRIVGPKVIRRIIDHFCPDNSRLLFFGASAGGFAALSHSAERPRSAVFVLNPRTNLSALPEVLPEGGLEDYGSDFVSSIFERAEDDLRVLYNRPRGNHIFHLQNLGDAWYLKCQYGPFRDALLNRSEYHRLTGHWGSGHVAPPTADYVDILAALVESAPDWATPSALYSNENDAASSSIQ